jgi:cyclophilin family peptidyl-prolyl cis-trans isomerase
MAAVKTRSWYVVGAWFAVLAILYGQSPPKQAVIETSAGTFVVDLSADVAPNHVANFIKLAQEGSYDGTVFHRMVKFGMVQGGDPAVERPDQTRAVRHGRTEPGQG